MDAKSLREAMKDKAKRLASATSEKVDSSTFTPAEMLDADVKTGMRPISKRALKAGGKVDGGDMKHHAGRRARKAGGRVDVTEKVGLANTDQKTANEDRDGKKHVGGFKKGGRTGKMGGGLMKGNEGIRNDAASLDAVGPNETGERMEPTKQRYISPSEADRLMAESNAAMRARGDLTRRKNGGKADKWEGSAKDEAQDKKLAKKRGMSMKEWEASKADEKHDEQKSMKGLKRGGHVKGCMCKACGGSAGYKDGGGLYANIHAKQERGEKMRKPGQKGAPTEEAFEAAKRTARKDGGKVKGKTNINIIISPHHDGQLGSMGQQPMPPAPPIVPPRPPVAAAAPMPMPGPVGVPPGLGQTMPAAAGIPPTPPAGMPPMMARKDGGKVYPKMRFGAGSGEGRLEKVEKYGKNA